MKFHPPYVSGQMPLLKEEVPSMTPTMENAVAEQTDHQQQHIEASVTAAVIPNSPSSTPSPSSSPLRPTPPLLQTPPPPERAGTQVLPAGAKNVDISYFDSMPPGYRFSPLDDELVVHYLQNKVLGRPLPRNRIIEVNLYAHNPEKLAEEYRQFGEKEWYFFTPRDKKYRNGCRPNRAAGDGYWKATGADRPVYHRGNVVGSRKALVFYSGKAPKGDKTNWIMHEFRVKDAPLRSTRTGPNDMRLDDSVLCRIYKKSDKNSCDKNNHIGRGRHKDEDHFSPTHHDYGDVINGVDVHDHNNMSVDATELHYDGGNNTSVDALEPHYGCGNNMSVDDMEPQYGGGNNTSVDAMEPDYGGGNGHTASLMYTNTSIDYFEPTASFHNRSLNNYNNFHTLVSNFAADGNRMTMVESVDVDPIPLLPMMHIEPASVINPGYLNQNVNQNSNYLNQNCLIGSSFRRVGSTGAPYPNVVSLDKIVQPHNLGPDSHI